MTPLLQTHGLACAFGGIRAVDRVDFTLMPGEIRAIIGPNGAGKTTFVGLVCGRFAPDAGRIVFDGRDITAWPAHRRVRLGIAYTFQITSIFRRLTVCDNVALAALRAKGGGAGPGDRRLRRAALEALERVGLGAEADAIAGELAYGHQRLLEVAMGLALRPRLLILDEPTQGLSDGEIENFAGLIRSVAAGEATVLLIEHNMPLVMQLAGRITVFERGRILAEGAPEAIRSSREVQDAYLGAAADG